MYRATTATHKIASLKKRIRGVSGGTSASKSISILLWLIDYAQTHNNELISIVSESFPHLKRGVMRDFLNIMEQHNYYNDSRWNRTDFVYTFETNTKIEFFSADQPGKVRGPRRHVLFINEANNILFETYNQLEVRTMKIIWLDWNPVSEFWWYTEVAPHVDHDFITLTYKDNEALDPAIVQSIESRKHNKNWWSVYGMGQLGEVESRIYTGWSVVDEIPENARLERYGLDFGYSNDPTAIVGVYYLDGGIILDELLYRKGLQNSEIYNFLSKQPEATIIADSAEPKSIEDILLRGLDIIPTTKGPGSVLQGIQAVQDCKVMVTKRSVNLLKEYRNYLWDTDKDGRIINKPLELLDHCMDAVRYAVQHLMGDATGDLKSLDPEVRKQNPGEGKIPGTYIPPSPVLTDDDDDWDSPTTSDEEWL